MHNGQTVVKTELGPTIRSNQRRELTTTYKSDLWHIRLLSPANSPGNQAIIPETSSPSTRT